MLGSIHPDVRGAVYAMGAMSGNDALFSQLRSLYQKVTSPEERERLLSALSWAASSQSQQLLLAMLLTDEVKLQDAGLLLTSFALRGGASFAAAWDFIFSPKFDMLIQRFTDNGGGAAYSLGNRISTLSSYLTDFGRMGDLEVLAKKYDGALVDASDFLDGARAHVQANQMFMTSTAPTLCMWLQEHNDIKR